MKHIFRFGISSTVFVLGIFLCLAPAKAATLTVCASGTAGQNGCQYIGGDGIQQAVDAAAIGTNENPTTINIKSGTYSRNTSEKFEDELAGDGVSGGLAMISTRKKHLILKGEGPSTVLTGDINRQYGGIVAEGGSVVIENLKIINLYRNTTECDQPYCSWGDAIRLHHVSNSRIANTILESGETGRNGIDARSSKNILIKNNSIVNNRLRGIMLWKVNSAIITNNNISNNLDYAVIMWGSTGITINNNLISKNALQGISLLDESSALILNNVISMNKHSGISCSMSENEHCRIINNIITNNEWFGIAGRQDVLRSNLVYGNVNGNFGGTETHTDTELIAWGNKQIDPKFVSETDFHLQGLSPAFNAGDANLKDPDGSRSDMGMYGGSNACPGSNCPSAFKPILLNSSFDWGTFGAWEQIQLDKSFVADSQRSDTSPGSDGRYYAKLTRVDNLPGGSDPHLASDWIETGQNLTGKQFELSFDIKAHNTNATIKGILIQREPKGNDWGQGSIVIPDVRATSDWQTFTFRESMPGPGDGTRFRIVLRPEVSLTYALPIYYDNIRVTLIDAAPPTNTPVQTQEGDVNGDGHITLADYDQIVADFANYNLQLLNKVVSFLMQ